MGALMKNVEDMSDLEARTAIDYHLSSVALESMRKAMRSRKTSELLSAYCTPDEGANKKAVVVLVNAAPTPRQVPVGQLAALAAVALWLALGDEIDRRMPVPT